MQSSMPLLVIVSGAPATGKTTLARRLAMDLRLLLVTKDDLKEALADAADGPIDLPTSIRLGLGAYAVMYRVAERLLEAGAGLVLESNFRGGLSETELRPLAMLSHAGLVHCTADAAVITSRYTERHLRGERHAAHRDADRSEALARDLAEGRFEPLDLPIPTMLADTTDGYDPAYEQIRVFAAWPPSALLR
jgi:predicted kinase